MDPVAAKYIGAGLACLGMAGAGIGLGNLFGQFLSGALRNPSAADGQRGTLLLGFALTEALGIFSLLIALLLLFAVSCPRNPRSFVDSIGEAPDTPRRSGAPPAT